MKKNDNFANEANPIGKNVAWMIIVILFLISGCSLLPMHSQITTQPAKSPEQIIDPISQDQGISEGVKRSSMKNVNITGGCPGTGWDIQKMLDNGERLYSFYCAGCHGREAQGNAYGYFPALVGEGGLSSEKLDSPVFVMMNTDIHPMASLLFERDALSVINYVRQSFSNQESLVCPGDVDIHINP